MSDMSHLKPYIREISGFPRPGVNFKDIGPLLLSPVRFREAINEMAMRSIPLRVSKIVAIDARGFIFGSALAYTMKRGLVLARKKGKLPGTTMVSADYSLEYASAALEMQLDAILMNERVLIVDDVLATGGTAAAAAELVRGSGGIVCGFAFLLELAFLGGARNLRGEVFSLISFDK